MLQVCEESVPLVANRLSEDEEKVQQPLLLIPPQDDRVILMLE